MRKDSSNLPTGNRGQRKNLERCYVEVVVGVTAGHSSFCLEPEG